jgi:peptidoglycan/LPS O-acetylase OafA/YrhL
MKKHNYIVDFCRFAAICIIMTHHAYIMGYSGDYPFARGWAWVDYFFMLTGYFTMAHFTQKKPEPNTFGRTAVDYTLRKFAAFMPLAIVCILIQYILVVYQSGPDSLAAALRGFINMPYEMLMLSSVFGFNPNLSPLWFVAAMFITLPLLCYCVNKFRDVWYILSFLIPMLYYGRYGINTVRDWPMEMVRAFACMTFGTFCYYAAERIRERRCCNFGRIMLTIIEALSFVLAVDLTRKQEPELVFLVLLFPIQLSIMMSGESLTAKINGAFFNKIFSLLGKMSMPMFILHWLVGTAINIWAPVGRIRLVLYYGGTMLLSAVYVGVSSWKAHRDAKTAGRI